MKNVILYCVIMATLLANILIGYYILCLFEHIFVIFLYTLLRVYYTLTGILDVLLTEIKLDTKKNIYFYLTLWIRIWLFYPEYVFWKNITSISTKYSKKYNWSAPEKVPTTFWDKFWDNIPNLWQQTTTRRKKPPKN